MNIQQAKQARRNSMSITNAIKIQTILGLDADIEFKVHNKPFQSVHGLVDGLTTTYTDGTYMVEFVANSDAVHTILHELAHVDGNVRGEGRSCGDCEEFADDVLEWVMGEL